MNMKVITLSEELYNIILGELGRRRDLVDIIRTNTRTVDADGNTIQTPSPHKRAPFYTAHRGAA